MALYSHYAETWPIFGTPPERGDGGVGQCLISSLVSPSQLSQLEAEESTIADLSRRNWPLSPSIYSVHLGHLH